MITLPVALVALATSTFSFTATDDAALAGRGVEATLDSRLELVGVEGDEVRALLALDVEDLDELAGLGAHLDQRESKPASAEHGGCLCQTTRWMKGSWRHSGRSRKKVGRIFPR